MTQIEIRLPTLHVGQRKIWRNRTNRNIVRCGRRFGKTKMMVTLGADTCLQGKKTGIFTPEYKQLQEPYNELLVALQPVRKSSSKNEGAIRAITGGGIDFWPLTDNELAGRGREYDRILVDEAAFTKNGQMFGIWERSIKPTMATKPNADVWIFSTPNGVDEENFFYRLCSDGDQGFKEHYAPSSESPYVTKEFLEEEKRRSNPLVFAQEYMAEFILWAGVSFFKEADMLIDDAPVPYPTFCDAVFAVLDTAVKGGIEHDATAVCFYALRNGTEHPLTLLDWNTIQIQGDLLETWLPTVFERLEELGKQCGARHGVQGIWIEDKATGSILLQQGERRGWPVVPIDSKLTSAGKDERAIMVSGYSHSGLMKISGPAYEKTAVHKGVTKNHFLGQVCGFVIGDKAAARRSDDLLDCHCYALAIAFGVQKDVQD